jgi:hypothetical protein
VLSAAACSRLARRTGVLARLFVVHTLNAVQGAARVPWWRVAGAKMARGPGVGSLAAVLSFRADWWGLGLHEQGYTRSSLVSAHECMDDGGASWGSVLELGIVRASLDCRLHGQCSHWDVLLLSGFLL